MALEHVNPGDKATASKINEIIDAINNMKVAQRDESGNVIYEDTWNLLENLSLTGSTSNTTWTDLYSDDIQKERDELFITCYAEHHVVTGNQYSKIRFKATDGVNTVYSAASGAVGTTWTGFQASLDLCSLNKGTITVYVQGLVTYQSTDTCQARYLKIKSCKYISLI